jgi:arsenite methyltransferase
MMPLTKLGKALGDLKITVDVPEAIPYMGIPAGKIDIQRLFYWHIFKAFYRHDFTLDEMNHINFDWYRPLNCHRFSPQEIKDWCGKSGLLIERLHVEEAGISVVAKKRRQR